MKRQTKKTPPKCQACKFAVKMPGKRGLYCSHGSSLGEFTTTEARRNWRWVELLTFRGLCSTAAVFFQPSSEPKKRGPKPKAKPPEPGTPLPGMTDHAELLEKKEGEE